MNKINLDHTDIAILDESDTYEMAEALISLAKENFDSRFFNIEEKEIETALYSLKNMARNPHNSDCYRHLFAALSLIADTDY